MDSTELEKPIMVHTKRVFCDGGGALGHPGVYLNLEDNKVVCPYCSRTFVLEDGVQLGSGH